MKHKFIEGQRYEVRYEDNGKAKALVGTYAESNGIYGLHMFDTSQGRQSVKDSFVTSFREVRYA